MAGQGVGITAGARKQAGPVELNPAQLEIRSTKLEIRNKFRSKFECSKPCSDSIDHVSASRFEHWEFGFVSNFDIRIFNRYESKTWILLIKG
ncbi:MAG: hypothetical protein C4519_09365 [Desulfobacteraceae bacterium]|nr:MAG: hypothetical protein C4519_09365 [Desulfobacteraceae bacterium]